MFSIGVFLFTSFFFNFLYLFNRPPFYPFTPRMSIVQFECNLRALKKYFTLFDDTDFKRGLHRFF